MENGSSDSTDIVIGRILENLLELNKDTSKIRLIDRMSMSSVAIVDKNWKERALILLGFGAKRRRTTIKYTYKNKNIYLPML